MSKQFLRVERILKLLGILVVAMFCVNTTFALVISEIHARPALVDGSQKGKEWIEVFNNSADTIDLTEFVLVESNGERPIVAMGEKNILSGEYAVIGQDYQKFKDDKNNSSFSGKFFIAAFASLTDTGEELVFKKSGKEVCGVSTYPSVSSSPYDTSLHYNGTGFDKGSASPGVGNLGVGTQYIQLSGTIASENQNANTGGATTTGTTSEGFVAPVYYYRSYWPDSEKIYLYVGENKTGVAGANINFSAQIVTGEKKPVSSANVFWSFGDGEEGQGKDVTHIYRMPGEYVVNVEAFAEGRKVEDKVYIKIVEGNFSIKLNAVKEEKFVELENKSEVETRVGGFVLETKGGEFDKNYTLPKNLSILPGKKISLAQETIRFATDTTAVSFLYPNGKMITDFTLPKKYISKIKEEKKTADLSTTTKVLGVYTKENFEKISTSTTLNYPSPKKNILKKLSFNNVRVKPEQKQEIVESENRFVVNQTEDSLLTNIFKYFGI